jgi:glycosyltransferase involved in cell wall biosynthesis
MRIALLGTRGIPANYGGFETFAEELSVRLVERGHKVTVYCRERSDKACYRGVQLRYLPTWRHKYFDTIAHTAFSTADLLVNRFDVVLYCNAANAIFTLLPRLLAMPTALNVDGLERHRKKWNQLAKSWYLISEWLATWCASAVVTDAEKIREYYLGRYGKDSFFIPYGAEVGKLERTDLIRELGLEPNKYVLYVSRMEPENNALAVRQAFERVRTDHKLALVGDAPYADDYITQVKNTTDPRIVIPGAIYGEGYRQLQSHCSVYVQATEVGGTHPALIEAMGRGALVLYLSTPESAEAAGNAAVPFDDLDEDLVQKLRWAVSVSDDDRALWGERAKHRVEKLYSWSVVTDEYEKLFRRLSPLYELANRTNEG